MDILNLTVRTQTDLANELEVLLDDTANNRWSVAQHYSAINHGIMDWGRRVLVPYLYEISGGFVEGTLTYTLPAYMDGFIRPQQYMPVTPMYEPTGQEVDSVWNDVDFWNIYPSSSGGRNLVLNYDPMSVAARIIWYAPNSMVPITATLPVTSAEILAGATSVTLTTKPTIGKAGYIKIDAEWMSYAGVTEAATTLTLTNLVRGLFGTTAATHTVGSTVTWGVAVHRTDLYAQMQMRCLVYLMALKLNNAAPTERMNYRDQMLYYEQKAQDFWRGYSPMWQPRLKLMRQLATQF